MHHSLPRLPVAGLPPPPPVPTARPTPTPSRHGGDHQGAEDGDVEIAGGVFFLGGQRSQRMVFDCEKWEHPVHLQPFRIARWYLYAVGGDGRIGVGLTSELTEDAPTFCCRPAMPTASNGVAEPICGVFVAA